jgi:formiminotetrahydrofolate cyclodeaminase
VDAICASLALGLLIMTLEVTCKRENSTLKRRELRRWLKSAKTASERALELADEDVFTFNAYLRSRWGREQGARKVLGSGQGGNALLRKATEIPLEVAGTALKGLGFCADSAEFVYRDVAADLDSAALILYASAWGALGSARANLLSVDRKTRYHARLISKADDLEREALQLLDRVRACTSRRKSRR